MNFDFPANPTPGQIFEPTAGVVYVWEPPVWHRQLQPLDPGLPEAPLDGKLYGRRMTNWNSVDVLEAPINDLTYGRKNASWSTIVGGAVLSDTPPPGPLQPGQFWYKTDTGNTYIYFDDGNSAQWVQQNIQQPATAVSVPATPGITANLRNRIVNPAMQVSQENGDTMGMATGWYAADQWFIDTVGFPVNFLRQQTAPGERYLNLGISTARPSPAAGDYMAITQRIEGIRTSDFGWGTVNAKPIVVRFTCVSTNAAIYSLSIRNSALNRTYLAPFTLAAGVWTTVTLVIPGDTTGTWLTDTGIGLSLSFGLGTGTTFGGGVAGWQAGNKLQIAGNSNLSATASVNFYVGFVGLYLDPLATGVAPRWEMPDEAAEFLTCMRYYETLIGAIFFGWNRVDGSQSAFNWIWRVRKRIIPATTLTCGTALNNYTTSVDGNSYYTAAVAYLDITAGTANARL